MGSDRLPDGSRASLSIGRWECGLRLDDRSRMSREVHVRICEGVRVRLPHATRLVIVVDAYPQHDWLLKAIDIRLREELATLQVAINEEKSRSVDLAQGESFRFLGFDFRR